MPLTFVFAVAFVMLATLVVAITITTWNTVVALRRRSERAWANVDVCFKQRHDELPAVAAAVRGQLGFEQQVLEEVTRLRAAYQPQARLPDQAATSEATSRALRSLFAAVERYPELRSNQNVMALQEEIERLETLIARRRELYNEQIYQHNSTIGQVPAVFLAGIFGWRPLPSFAAEGEERERMAVALAAD